MNVEARTPRTRYWPAGRWPVVALAGGALVLVLLLVARYGFSLARWETKSFWLVIVAFELCAANAL
jgi:hypothetical protein